MSFYIYNEQGFLEWEVSSESAIPAGLLYTSVPPDSELIRPKFNNSTSSWSEGGSIQYIPTMDEIVSNERIWRNAELNRADIELNKVQDGMGTGTVAAWREYRCSLRDWPESRDFPDSTKRPVAPDA
jgi:hypothetical protein